MNPFAVIFDMDGVLVDSEVVAARVESELFTEVGIEVGVEDIYDRFVGLSQASVIDLVRREWNVELPDWFLTERLERIRARFTAAGHCGPDHAARLGRAGATRVASQADELAAMVGVTGD